MKTRSMIAALAPVCLVVAAPAPAQAISNPASVFCGKMGGRSVVATLPDKAQIGLCYLPGKKIVEEWTLYRMFDGKKPSPRHNPFR